MRYFISQMLLFLALTSGLSGQPVANIVEMDLPAGQDSKPAGPNSHPNGLAAQNDFSWSTEYGKSPTQFTPAEWREIIDSTWGPGIPTAEKLLIFDRWWDEIDRNFGAFFNLDLDIFELRDTYRPEIEAGVSRGRFAAIMNYFGYRLKDLHTYLFDVPVRNTPLRKGVPLLVIGQWGTNRHFGALLTPLPDSTLLIYKTLQNHPLGLEPGDLVLGYDNMLWKDIYPTLLRAELPLLLNSVNASTDEGNAYYHLQAAGLNWHLFDTIDIVKYNTGDTLHFNTNLLTGQNRTIWGSEQIDVPGVEWPDRSLGERVSWGVVDGTDVGYVFVTSWSFDPQFRIRQLFREAIDHLMNQLETDGLILDFRFNTGGGALAVDGLSLLFNEVTPTVGFDRRAGSRDHFEMVPDLSRPESALVIRPEPNTYYDKPIAVLIGPGSISSGELEALRISFHPRARLFGKPTAGAFTGSDFINLGNSDWFASRASGPAYYVSNHEYLSHVALEPDQPVWFTRDDVANGTDTVVRAALDWIDGQIVSVDDDLATRPDNFALSQNYPNPFNPETSIRYSVGGSSHIVLKIYDVLGNEVKTLVDQTQPAGSHTVIWNGRDQLDRSVSSGVYFYKLESGGIKQTKKMMLMK